MVADLPRAILTPEDVLALPQERHEDGQRWWMIFAGSPFERRAVSLLEAAGAICVPLVERVRDQVKSGLRKGEKREYDRSLFAGYIFCNADRFQIGDARDEFPFQQTRIINQARNAQQIADVFLMCSLKVNISRSDVKPGDKVRVLYGPFAGKVGTVLPDPAAPNRIWFESPMFGQMVGTEIDVDDVEAL